MFLKINLDFIRSRSGRDQVRREQEPRRARTRDFGECLRQGQAFLGVLWLSRKNEISNKDKSYLPKILEGCMYVNFSHIYMVSLIQDFSTVFEITD